MSSSYSNGYLNHSVQKSRVSFRNGFYIVSNLKDAVRVARGGAQRIHLANHCYPNLSFLYSFSMYYKRSVLSVPPCIHKRISKRFQAIVKILQLPTGRKKFWDRYVIGLVRNSAWELGEAGAICSQLFLMGIRLSKRALLKWMYKNGLRHWRPPGW